MAALKSDYGLLDLLPETLDLILSYLSDIDLLNVRKVCVQFEESFRRLICRKRRKLNFSKCYQLREEELIEVLEIGRDYITSVNINHCYWLTPDSLKLIMKLPNLQELHMLDCGTLSLPLMQIFPLGLSALSFGFNKDWRLFLYGKVDVGYKYRHKLFGNLKQLTIHIEDGKVNGIAHYAADVVFRYCLQLETLTVYESGVFTYDEPSDTLDYPDGLLPKLTKLHMKLNGCQGYYDPIFGWMKAIFMQRKTLLTEVYLGKSSYWLLEEFEELTLPCITAEELPVVCLDNYFPQCYNLPAIPKIWMGRKTPKCKVVSFQSLTLKCFSVTSTFVAELGPQLQELHLRNCRVAINDLVTGLTTIAKHCTQLTKLDVTLESSVVTGDLITTISQFKALKVLYMSFGLLSRSKYLSNPETVPRHQTSRIGSQMEISEESMRSSRMWSLTQSCMEIEDFRLTNEKWIVERVVCESEIACISNWKKLKELHLVNIPTLGQGSFLPFITKSCSQLTNLYLANVCCEGTCIYMMSLIESLSHATGLKDLSIKQEMKLSSVLSTALGNCLGLERLYFKSLVIKPEECGGFTKLILELPKLVLVWVEGQATATAVIKTIGIMLKSLKSTRPSLSYYIKNNAHMVDRQLPLVHLELNCYENLNHFSYITIYDDYFMH